MRPTLRKLWAAAALVTVGCAGQPAPDLASTPAGVQSPEGTAPTSEALDAIEQAVARVDPSCGTIAFDEGWPSWNERFTSSCLIDAVGAEQPARLFVTGRDAEGGALLADYLVDASGTATVTRWHADSTGAISSSTATCTVRADGAVGGPYLTDQGSVFDGEFGCLPGPETDGLGRAFTRLADDGDVPESSATFRTTGLTAMIGLEATGYCEVCRVVYFFDDGEFVGTDVGAIEPATEGRRASSAASRVEWQDGTTVAISYGLYRAGEPNCCPTGGSTTVRFQMVDGTLAAIDPIPPSRLDDPPLGR